MALSDIANRVGRPLDDYERALIEEMAEPLDYSEYQFPYVTADRAAMVTLILALRDRTKMPRPSAHTRY